MNTIKELGFIVGYVYFTKDDLTYTCTEEYLTELKNKGLIDLSDILYKLANEETNIS